MSVSEKFKEKWSSEKKFYSSLTGNEISDKEYEHAFKDWNNEKDERFAGLEIKMGCFIVIRCVWKSLKYLLKYLRNVRNSTSCTQRISHYLSAPVLCWDSIINMAKIDLELISDANMSLFFEKSTRGGDSYISEL